MENLRWLLYQYDYNWKIVIGQNIFGDILSYLDITYFISKSALNEFKENYQLRDSQFEENEDSLNA